MPIKFYMKSFISKDATDSSLSNKNGTYLSNTSIYLRTKILYTNLTSLSLSINMDNSQL